MVSHISYERENSLERPTIFTHRAIFTNLFPVPSICKARFDHKWGMGYEGEETLSTDLLRKSHRWYRGEFFPPIYLDEVEWIWARGVGSKGAIFSGRVIIIFGTLTTPRRDIKFGIFLTDIRFLFQINARMLIWWVFYKRIQIFPNILKSLLCSSILHGLIL